MIEAAYVLPVMMLMVLAMVDAVSYAADRLAANGVMADAYQLMMGQGQALASDNTLTLATVQCNSGQVELDTSGAQSLVKTGFESLFDDLNESDISVDVQQSDTTPLSYVFHTQFPSQTLFLPDAFAENFPVKAKLIISFDLTC